MNAKYFSRKFIVTMILLLGVPGEILIFKVMEIDTGIQYAVLALQTAVGTAYGVVNMKHAANKKTDVGDEDETEQKDELKNAA